MTQHVQDILSICVGQMGLHVPNAEVLGSRTVLISENR